MSPRDNFRQRIQSLEKSLTEKYGKSTLMGVGYASMLAAFVITSVVVGLIAYFSKPARYMIPDMKNGGKMIDWAMLSMHSVAGGLGAIVLGLGGQMLYKRFMKR